MDYLRRANKENCRYELQRRLASSTQLSNISILAVDPGAMPNTWLLKDASSSIRFLVDYVLGYMVSTLVWFNPNGSYRTTWKSAGDLLSASFNEKDYGEHPQALYLDGSRVAEAGPEARDQEKQKALWAASVKLAAVKAGDTVLNIQE